MKEAEKTGLTVKAEIMAAQSEQEVLADREFAREGEMFELGTVETRVLQLQQIAGQSVLEIGRLLSWMKARSGHGEFAKSLERMGINHSTAIAYMKVYKSLAKRPNSQTSANLGVSKALELVRNYEEEELEALGQGEAIDGHTLDEFAGMSYRELKATLRRERENSEKELKAVRKQTDSLQKRNDTLAQQIEHRESGSDGGWEYTAQWLAQMRELNMQMNSSANQLMRLAENWAKQVENGDPRALAGHPFILSDLNFMRNLVMNTMDICAEALDRAHAADHPGLMMPDGIKDMALGFSRTNLPKDLKFTQNSIEEADRADQ